MQSARSRSIDILLTIAKYIPLFYTRRSCNIRHAIIIVIRPTANCVRRKCAGNNNIIRWRIILLFVDLILEVSDPFSRVIVSVRGSQLAAHRSN